MTTHIHFPRTTAAQRRLLFETWEATGDIAEACRTAHVGQRTFYNWKGRFETAGYAGLAEFRSHAPKEPHRIAPEIETQVKALRTRQPSWGKQRIADEFVLSTNRLNTPGVGRTRWAKGRPVRRLDAGGRCSRR
jgi:hypothetical protein